MLTLLLDTSTERGLVAIAENEHVLAFRAFETPFNQAQLLLPTLEQLMMEASLRPTQIERIGIGIGPGSYTGIRVAATVAKTLAFSLSLPLVGIPTLMTLIPEAEGPYAAIVDARVGGAYVLMGHREGQQIHYISESVLIALSELGVALENVPHLVSPNAAPLKRRLATAFPEMVWQWEEKGPEATQMAHLVHHQYTRGHYSMDGQLDLLYLRKTQAEIERATKAAGHQPNQAEDQ